MTEEDIKSILEQLSLKSNNERQFVMYTGSGYNKRNRNKQTGRFENGSTYIKGGIDLFNEAMKRAANNLI